MKAVVHVTLKEEVLDSQGDAVRRALNAHGFPEVARVRIGKLIEIDLGDELEDPAAALKSMCEKLLANPVIEDHHIASIETS